MSIIKKAICDNCSKEIDYKDWYYTVGDITEQSESCANGQKLFEKADLCKNCYNKIFNIQHGFIKPHKEDE